MIFDTHTHLNIEEFAGREDEELALAAEMGVTQMNIVGFDKPTIDKSLALSEKYDQLYSTIGWHPTEAGSYSQEIEDMIVSQLDNPKVVALGEIGLDYYWHKEKEEHLIHQKVFRQQMDIAREKQLPFIIHSRDAAEDTLNIVKEYMTDGMYGGVIHCFSYSKEIAREYLNMGLYLGIGGVVTFKNSRKLKEVADYAPLNQILLETDCPYMAPVPNRGKRNSSLYLPEVVKTIAEIKGISCEEVVAVTESNAMKVLNLI